MKNLHLMYMDSNFNSRLADVLNHYFPHEINYYIWRTGRSFLQGIDNGVVDPTVFNAEQINQLSKNYDQVFLHSLWLKDREIIKLTDETATKIIWVVWGHDLYRRLPNIKPNPRSIAYYVYKWLQKNSIFYRGVRRKAASKVSLFRGIAIGYSYDEIYIRKVFGPDVPVMYGPYFSKDSNKDQLDTLRTMHREESHGEINTIIGHCGAEFCQHEKYLRKLAPYKNENIHIYLIMSYLATKQRIEAVRKLARRIYREDQFTIITESMPQDVYFKFLTKMDVAIFPFRHQSALGNTKRMAYMGTKLYFDPRGVLAKGFLAGGVKTCDCRKIGKILFDEFSKPVDFPDPSAKLFESFEIQRCVSAWKKLLTGQV